MRMEEMNRICTLPSEKVNSVIPTMIELFQESRDIILNRRGNHLDSY